jgi:hypothetical protein
MTNTIQPDGKIKSLNLTAGQSLKVRNYREIPIFGPPPTEVQINGQFTMDSAGTLSILFDTEAWSSLISFEPSIPVALGGTLELNFALGVNVASQIGRTIRIFDWSGVTPVGRFEVVSPYAWDVSRLYTTGEITLVPEPAAATLLAIGLIGCVAFGRRAATQQ